MSSGKFKKSNLWSLAVIAVLVLAATLTIYIQRRPAVELEEAKHLLTDFHKHCVAYGLDSSGVLFETMEGLVRKKLTTQATADRWFRLIEVEPRGMTQSDEGHLPFAWTRWRGQWVVITLAGDIEIMDDAALQKRRVWN